MKSFTYIALAISIAAALISFAACRKVSHNGSLDGQWQIMTIEDAATGQSAAPVIPSYISFNLHLIQLSYVSGDSAPRITGNMTYDKNAETIFCDFTDDQQPNVEAALAPFGIFSNPVTLQIVKLDRKSLVLRTDRSLITCRRF